MRESIQLSTPIDNSSSVDSAAAGSPSLLTNLVQKYIRLCTHQPRSLQSLYGMLMMVSIVVLLVVDATAAVVPSTTPICC